MLIATVICAAVLAIFPQASAQNLMNTIASSLYTLVNKNSFHKGESYF
jgi:hypothetical protein